MFVSAPETSSRISFSKSRVRSEDALRTSRFEHDFRNLHRVFLRNVHEEVNVVPAKTKFAKLETISFEFSECCSARIDVRLFQKAIVSKFGHEHHRDPVVARVRTIKSVISRFTTQVLHKSSPERHQRRREAPRALRFIVTSSQRKSLPASHLRVLR